MSLSSFALSGSDLHANKTLSAFLHNFEHTKWPEVVRLTLLYAIERMRGERVLSSMSWNKLQKLCGDETGTPKSSTKSTRFICENVNEINSSMSHDKHTHPCVSQSSAHSHIASTSDQTKSQSLKDCNAFSRGGSKRHNTATRELRARYTKETVNDIGLNDTNGTVAQTLTSDVHNHRPTPYVLIDPNTGQSVLHSTQSNATDADMVPVKQAAVGPQVSASNRLLSRRRRDIHKRDAEAAANAISSLATKRKSRVPKPLANTKRIVPKYLRSVKSKLKARIEADKAACERRSHAQTRNVERVAAYGLEEGWNGKVDLHMNKGKTKSYAPTSSILDITESFLASEIARNLTGPRKDTDMFDFLSRQKNDANKVEAFQSAPSSTEELSTRLSEWATRPHVLSSREQHTSKLPAPDPASYSWAPRDDIHRPTPMNESVRNESTKEDVSSLSTDMPMPMIWKSDDQNTMMHTSSPNIGEDCTDWVGKFGPYHTWTIPVTSKVTGINADVEKNLDNDDHRESSPFRGTFDTVPWEFDSIVDGSDAS